MGYVQIPHPISLVDTYIDTGGPTAHNRPTVLVPPKIPLDFTSPDPAGQFFQGFYLNSASVYVGILDFDGSNEAFAGFSQLGADYGPATGTFSNTDLRLSWECKKLGTEDVIPTLSGLVTFQVYRRGTWDSFEMAVVSGIGDWTMTDTPSLLDNTGFVSKTLNLGDYCANGDVGGTPTAYVPQPFDIIWWNVLLTPDAPGDATDATRAIFRDFRFDYSKRAPSPRSRASDRIIQSRRSYR